MGTAAVFSEMTQMTISLIFILLEATRDMQYVLPLMLVLMSAQSLMLVLMSAQFRGNVFNKGLYNIHIHSNVPILNILPSDKNCWLDLRLYKNRAPYMVVNDTSLIDVCPMAELLAWHHRFSHTPFLHLRDMALQGILPKRLAHCAIPKCPGYMYGKVTKQPWQCKVPTNQVGAPAVINDRLEACASVDQLKSLPPGLVAQLKGTPTRSQYKYTTVVFVDNSNDLAFIHLQQTSNTDEKL